MKTTFKLAASTIFSAGLLAGSCVAKNLASWGSIQNPEVLARLKSFVAEKKAQVEVALRAKDQTLPGIKPFFAAAAKGDWLAVSNLFEDFRNHAPQYYHPGSKNDGRLRGTVWQAIIETYGAFEGIALGDEKYRIVYGQDIIDSIPPGGIYFGGTDAGRFVVTALQRSQVKADPFFTLTENQLVASGYLKYLHSMYAETIYIPTLRELQQCFKDYTQDAQQRLKEHKLKPGEQIETSGGGIEVSSPTAVMEINGLLAKVIFDKNPDRDFYIEESVPLDWMYPYLEPHGLIFKINRQPLPELPNEIIKHNDDYWTKIIQPMIGDWLTEHTSVEEIAAFAKKAFLRRDFDSFTGDPQFVDSAPVTSCNDVEPACETFSQARASIADLYLWRMNHTGNASEKERMAHEADFAFRQALALCPYNFEAVKDYTAFLKNQNRSADAALIGAMAQQFR